MKRTLLTTLLLLVLTGPLAGQALDIDLKATTVFGPDAPERKLRQTALQKKREEVNRRDREEWAKITTKETWEKFRDGKLALLRQSLAPGEYQTKYFGKLEDALKDFNWFPEPAKLKTLTTKKIEGDGFVIENLVYESRPHLVVTANLYSPAKPPSKAPGILIIHSHHNPKTQGELQDMGMLWARAGCYVLIPDQLGHGERRQHPFATEKDYPLPFKVGRQDYFFRYNVAAQLHLVGESLIGWMVWDMMRGIDLLLTKPGIDKDKIVVLGSVAGGGDPCAVLAALDGRVAVAAPFNFGGPQPETKFPLPKNADKAFNFMGGSSWESTRNLRLSGQGGFLPWVIVASQAPRGLIYAHEFAWDEARDPVWKGLQKIYGFYDKGDYLAELHGRGAVTGKPPDATHCNNIGLEHRKGIHPPLAKWLGFDGQEYSKRIPSADLQCMTAEARAKFDPLPVAALAAELADQRLAEQRKRKVRLEANKWNGALKQRWADLLGIRSLASPGVRPSPVAKGTTPDGFTWNTMVVRHKDAPEIAVPVLMLWPKVVTAKTPAVVAVAQGGKAGFLKHRAEEIRGLLDSGVAVCLPDLRGCGEMRTTGEGRGRTSADTAISAAEWMHGDTVLGTQIQELLAVLTALRIDGIQTAALWGDSFTPVNAATAKLSVPYDVDAQPAIGEPMGGLVALSACLLADDKVQALYIRGGLASFRSVLESPFFYLPHDALVPGVLTVGDIDDVAAALASRPIRIEAAINAQNQRITGKELAAAFALTQAAGQERLALRESPSSANEVAEWLAKALSQK